MANFNPHLFGFPTFRTPQTTSSPYSNVIYVGGTEVHPQRFRTHDYSNLSSQYQEDKHWYDQINEQSPSISQTNSSTRSIGECSELLTCLVCIDRKPVKVPSKFMIGHISHHFNYLPVKCITCNELFGSLSVFEWHLSRTNHPEKYLMDKDKFMDNLVKRVHNFLQSVVHHLDPPIGEVIELQELLNRCPINSNDKIAMKTMQKVCEFIHPYLPESAISDDNIAESYVAPIIVDIDEPEQMDEEVASGGFATSNIGTPNCSSPEQRWSDNFASPGHQVSLTVESEVDSSVVSHVIPKKEPVSAITLLDHHDANGFDVSDSSNDVEIQSTVDVGDAFRCDVCSYATNVASNFKKHFETRKHKDIFKGVRDSRKSVPKKIVACQIEQNQLNISESSYLNNNIDALADEPDIIEPDLDQAFRFKCNLCPFFAHDPSNFNQHLATKMHRRNMSNDVDGHQKVVAKCKKCGVYVCFYSMAEHIQASHTVPPETVDIETIETEEYSHYSELSEPGMRFICNICGLKQTRESHMRYHMITHSTAKPFKCRKCNARYKRRNSLWKHMGASHQIGPAAVSDRRKKKKAIIDWKEENEKVELTPPTPSRRRRARDTSDLHEGSSVELLEKSPEIEADYTYYDEGPKESRYRCNQCDSHYPFKSLVVRHLRNHASDRPFQCENCSIRFVRIFDLLKHQKKDSCAKLIVMQKDNTPQVSAPNATQILHKCESCTFQTQFKSVLSVHNQTHNKLLERKTLLRNIQMKRYRCKKCMTVFGNIGAFVKHRNQYCNANSVVKNS